MGVFFLELLLPDAAAPFDALIAQAAVAWATLAASLVHSSQ